MTHELDRRTTLAGIGALGLSAAACGSAQVPAPGRKLGYAIVGLGYYATRMIMPRFAECKYSRLTALVSGTPAKLEQYGDEYKIRSGSRYTYANFDSISDNPDVDIVYVVLPNSMHADYTIRAAKAGKHVMCEKPMAVSSAECQAMIAACRTAGKKLMIGYRSQLEPHNLHAMRLARSGTVGKPALVESEHGFPIGDPGQWRLKRSLAGGGSMMDIGIYSVQALRYMAGEEPISVSAIEHTDRNDIRFREVEDRLAWTFQFPSGLLGQGFSSYSSGHNHIRLTGDKGAIDLDPGTAYGGHTLSVRVRDKEEQVTPPKTADANQFSAQLDHLAHSIMTGGEPIAGGEEGLRDLRIIEAIYRAAKEGRNIRI